MSSLEYEYAVPKRPDELTNAFLQRILTETAHRKSAAAASDDAPALVVTGFEWKPLDVGVISEVVSVTVFVRAHDSNDASAEKHLVAKFLRPEFPFESMFLVESTFYSRFNNANGTTTSSFDNPTLPFAIPTPVFTSNVLIVLERVASVETLTCVDGCPRARIPRLVTSLAQFHARFAACDTTDLAAPAGIGASLRGNAKRTQFPGLWTAFLDDVVELEAADRKRLAEVCTFLSANATLLEVAHDAVESGPQTLIHGDYHVANMLFPIASESDSTSESELLWLLDWATCGRGNPMRDLAFFFIVSVREDDRRALEASSLQLYSDTHSREHTAASNALAFSVTDWMRAYRVCVLNQFVILVVYDHLSKHLAANAKTLELQKELDAHFRTVNLRACLAVLDHVGDTEQLTALLAK